MAVADRQKKTTKNTDKKVFSLCPFWQSGTNTSSSSSSSTQNLTQSYNGNGINNRHVEVKNTSTTSSSKTVSSVARSLLPARRRLRLDPSNNLYFPYEPGKQVRTAIRLKNTSRSHVAFKVNYLLIHLMSFNWAVFKFVELPENNEKVIDQKSKVKFKIMSLKVKGGIEYVPELFDEQKDQVTVERILRVVFLDVQQPSPALEKLKRQLSEADAALEAHKKPPPDTGPRVVGEGLVIDEWKERREKYLARQKVEAIDSS
eukprot:XP_025014330.1 vesicle-associated protein 4-1 [Ricinus communis]